MEFRNGRVTLAGTLVLPKEDGKPHPAVVMIHGDGPATRSVPLAFAREFAKAGIAALAYDKRGTGESSGDWSQASFADLAGDALAGVDFLKRRSEIDRERIGLWGGSQGGWISLLAASRSREVSFLVVVSGPVMSPARKALWTSTARVRRAGFGEEVMPKISRLMEIQFQILRTGAGWDSLDAEVAKDRGQPWYPLVAVMRHSDWRSSWMSYGRDIDFDPLPILENLSIPGIWLAGEQDTEVPAVQTEATLDRMRATHGKDYTFRVFHDADHLVQVRKFFALRGPAPGFYESMIAWTRLKTGAGPHSARIPRMRSETIPVEASGSSSRIQ